MKGNYLEHCNSVSQNRPEVFLPKVSVTEKLSTIHKALVNSTIVTHSTSIELLAVMCYFAVKWFSLGDGVYMTCVWLLIN